MRENGTGRRGKRRRPFVSKRRLLSLSPWLFKTTSSRDVWRHTWLCGLKTRNRYRVCKPLKWVRGHLRGHPSEEQLPVLPDTTSPADAEAWPRGLWQDGHTFGTWLHKGPQEGRETSRDNWSIPLTCCLERPSFGSWCALLKERNQKCHREACANIPVHKPPTNLSSGLVWPHM